MKLWDLRTLAARATLQTPVMTRCTRLVFDDTRIITGSLKRDRRRPRRAVTDRES